MGKELHMPASTPGDDDSRIAEGSLASDVDAAAFPDGGVEQLGD